MIDKLISFSIHNKLVIGMFIVALVAWGSFSLRQIPIDAVPDITTNQVQIITSSPTLAAQEVEQFVTFPIELAMSNLPEVVEFRSISRIGLSVVTVVFEEDADIYRARQLISEQLKIAESEIPEAFGIPELGPITTGLGEVYQYVLRADSGYEDQVSDMDLRTVNDWIVKRQLAGTPGVIEVSGWGGHQKQFEVAVNPERLNAMQISLAEVFEAIEANNENTGGSYIENQFNTYFIRGEGLVESLGDIEKIVVKTVNGLPIVIRDVATVSYGSAPRYGAITYNAQGEVVGGQVLMLKGENSYDVVQAVKDRIETVKKSLPEGVVLQPYLDRSELVGRAIGTVTTNLIEGGLIVILILVLLLGNFRGGLIVASVIPLAMLFAMGMMHMFGVSANLMSLGAIDFGLVVDGSVIIVEAILHRLSKKFSGQRLTSDQMDAQVDKASSRIRTSAAFGEIIILIVYLPILALVGLEGKMFRPMAQTVSFAILGALILSMTYVPMMSALFLKKTISNKRTLSDRIIGRLQKWYTPALMFSLRRKALVVVASLVFFGMSLFTFSRLGGEFIPTLEEGDIALHQIIPSGSSLQQSVEMSTKIQRCLLDSFPEVEIAVSKIGSAEIPTDPMPIEVGDIMVRMKPKDEWVSASSKEELFAEMERVLTANVPGVQYEFSQPIQMRFNELIAGVREDIGIKIFGENLQVLYQKAKEVEQIVEGIEGVGDLRVEQIQGLPQMIVDYDRGKIAQYDLNIRDVNTVVRTAFAGEIAGVVFEEERRFDLVVRLEKEHRKDIDNIRDLYIPLPSGSQIPLKEIALVEFRNMPMQISRDDAKRRVVVGVNARNRDTESLVEEISEKLDANLDLPPGYYIDFGGQFENLKAAKERLSIAVPAALLLIVVLLFFTFRSIKHALLIFTAVPLSAIGGIYALWLRDMPFSISAGVGFIALFGVAVLNGIVLIAYFNQLKKEGVTDMKERIIEGTKVRLRPVIMTAAVAALGFLPMALSNSAGAEVQRPLATVVIGGLITATFLTLLLLPVLYSIFDGMTLKTKRIKAGVAVLFICMGSAMSSGKMSAQAVDTLTLDKAIEISRTNHPSIRSATLAVDQQEALEKTAFDLDKTNVTYSSGQLNSSQIDYQWQVSQGFKFPTTYISQSKLQSEKVDLSKEALAVTEMELERNVRSTWLQVAFVQERMSLYSELAAVYQGFAEAARKRFEAGETNALEKATAESAYSKIVLQKNQAEADLLIVRQQLARWLGSPVGIELPSYALEKLKPPAQEVVDSSNPSLAYFDQQTAVAAQQMKVEKSGFLPDLNIGYFSQQIDGVGGLTGVQIGVGIPLFFWTQKGRVESAKIAEEIAATDYQAQLLGFNSLVNISKQEVRKYLASVDWYETQGLTTAEELSRFASKGYRAGEIDYLEYLNSMSQATSIRIEYLEVLNKYNQAVTNLQFYAGSFE